MQEQSDAIDHARAAVPKVEALMRDARLDLFAFTAFSVAHWDIWSTNPLERLNREVKRRADVVGVFHDSQALLRIAGAVLVEAHDERQASDRRHLDLVFYAPALERPRTA